MAQPKYASAKALKAKIQEYFEAQAADNDKFPSEAGMRLYLNLSKDEVAYYCNPDVNRYYKEFVAVFEQAKDMREAWLCEHAVDSKNATGCMNLLKQPANGGYIEKAQQQDAEVKITMRGAGANAKNFS